MTDSYRGWSISWEYGNFYAFGPNYDASWEGEEDGWVGNSESACARTREDLIEEIDDWFVASGIETEGHDPAEGHGAKHESPTAESGDAQEQSHD